MKGERANFNRMSEDMMDTSDYTTSAPSTRSSSTVETKSEHLQVFIIYFLHTRVQFCILINEIFLYIELIVQG